MGVRLPHYSDRGGGAAQARALSAAARGRRAKADAALGNLPLTLEAEQGVTTTSGIHAVPFTAEVLRITGLVPDAMADTWEPVFLSAREDDYMALMEATAAWQSA